jgi:carboxyl-terminal processing protease
MRQVGTMLASSAVAEPRAGLTLPPQHVRPSGARRSDRKDTVADSFLIKATALLTLTVGAFALEVPPVDFPMMAPSVGYYLHKYYYDHSRFKPKVMVERALRALETSEISIDADWDDSVVTLNVGGNIQKLPGSEPHDLSEAMELLEFVRLALDKSDFTVKERRNLAYNLLNGALLSLDPHTLILPPEPASEFDEDIAGEFTGIGAFLNQEEGLISIERVMPGLPAERAGVEDGDIILAIDGEKTVGLSLDQAVHRIKGPKNTTVALTIERKKVADPQVISIVRDRVQVITLRAYRDGAIGYVRMDEFNSNTARDLYKAINDMQSDSPVKGFIIDLRYNGGGLLDQARVISEFFLRKGCEVVRTVTLDGEPQIFVKDSPNQLLEVPMIVMTSGGSASAAEILAGGLQCNDVAAVVGQTTFGKGSVQRLEKLHDQSKLKLTIQEYQLPGGVSIQDVGVIPDVALVRHAIKEDGSIDLVPYSGMREVDDEFALAGHDTYKHDSSFDLGWLSRYQTKEQLRMSAISSREFQPDQEARLVMDLLAEALAQGGTDDVVAGAKATKTMRQVTLELLKKPIAMRAERESQALASALQGRNPALLWGPDAEPAGKSLSLTCEGPLTVKAGEDISLRFRIDNASPVELGRLYGVVHADKASPFWEEEIIFGKVSANGSAVSTMDFSVPPRLYGGEERFTVDVLREGHSEVLATLPVQLTVAAIPRPHFSYRWDISEPSGDGQINTGEATELLLTLMNDGDGDAAPTTMYVYKDNDPYVQLGAGRFKLDAIPAGQSVSVVVPLTVLPAVKRGSKMVPFAATEIKLKVQADERFADEVDGRYRAMLFNALVLPIDQPVKGRAVVQPLISLVECQCTPDQHANLSLKIADDNARYIALFRDDEKIDLKLSDAIVDGNYLASVPLKPGLNSVRVSVIDDDKVGELYSLRLWGPPVNPEAKPVVRNMDKTSKPDPNANIP